MNIIQFRVCKLIDDRVLGSCERSSIQIERQPYEHRCPRTHQANLLGRSAADGDGGGGKPQRLERARRQRQLLQRPAAGGGARAAGVRPREEEEAPGDGDGEAGGALARAARAGGQPDLCGEVKADGAKTASLSPVLGTKRSQRKAAPRWCCAEIVDKAGCSPAVRWTLFSTSAFRCGGASMPTCLEHSA